MSEERETLKRVLPARSEAACRSASARVRPLRAKLRTRTSWVSGTGFERHHRLEVKIRGTN